MAVSKRVRFEVLRRDEHRCRYCGARAPEVELTVDHVVPTALGGTDHPSNLVAACWDCNSGKTSTVPDAPLVAEVDASAVAWSRAMAVAAQERAAAYTQDRQLADDFRDMWEDWTWTDFKGTEHTFELPANFGESVRSILAAGLTMTDLEELMSVAMTTPKVKDRFRYFCGCCWTRVTQAQERAREILAAQQPPEPEVLPPPVEREREGGMFRIAEVLEQELDELQQLRNQHAAQDQASNSHQA
ncbi:HNH endonuclease [Nocardia higoensis]|uniref:HNH endonuclease n=1 Tax=Nocardia higoensis TaxID=228599 RepID=UPI002B4B1CB6|nr:HNH endonuclease [Nocardia higoensis]